MGASVNGGTPKSSILIGFSIINHPFWGTTILGNPQMKEIHHCTADILQLVLNFKCPEVPVFTLQLTNISHPGGKENHLQKCLYRGYVSSEEGNPTKEICFYLVNKIQFQSLACFANGNHLCMPLLSTPVDSTPDESLMLAVVTLTKIISIWTDIFFAECWRRLSH